MKKYNLFEIKMKDINILCIIIVVILLIVTSIILPSYSTSDINFIQLLIFAIPYFILHEIIHSIAYVLCGANFKNVTYGAHLEKGILCCSCKQNITKFNILVSLLAPFIIIGIITYIIGIVISNNLLIFLSIMNIGGSSGDLIMFYSLSRLKKFEFSEYDNPLAFGLYTDEDLSNKKLRGLKYIGSLDTLEKTITKKITISKTSIIFFIIILVLLIIEIIKYIL
ncbi:MAG: DUF3267 domain-containing protein [Bacilli bacterium]|nr:DUF3267 domain-containing protein [Bacilli bacterium]